jgi:hypothetical protein
MGEVVRIAAWQAARDARERVEMERSMHPSLRWVAGREWWQAHARKGGSTVCGTEGRLILAPPGIPLCTTCYPQNAAPGE